MTDETLKRVFAAYDASYRNLVKSLRDAFPRLEQAGSISTLVRQGAIAAELGEALKFIDPAAAKELEALGRDTIRQAGELGQQLAGDTLNYVGVQSTFTTVPVGAVRNQAERFRERLVNYSDQQASAISAVVEQGLIQGWGTRKVEGQLRGLGVSFKSNAETVARTEVMSAYNGAARSRYEQAGVAYIQWIATPAEGTCSLCYARNTKVWKITEAPSVPAHPRCRCTILPVSSLDQIDTAFYEAYSQDGLDDLARQKLAPDNGLTYWEKKAGATLAKPVWVPGQVIPKPEPLTASSLKWTRPPNIPAEAKLEVVDIDQVWKDYQENGITLDMADPATRARVDRLKADILKAVESGGKFTAPKLTFASAGNEFNIPPGFDVTDGRHRITAFKELGFTSVKAYVDGDKSTAAAKPKPEPVKKTQGFTRISGEDGTKARKAIKQGFTEWDRAVAWADDQMVDLDIYLDVSVISESLAKQKATNIRAITDESGSMQAAAYVENRSNHLYVELLATSPWNTLARAGINVDSNVQVSKGAGTEMMRQIVIESLNKGYGGEVRLESLPGALGFYKKIGFSITETGDLPKMKLTAKKAIEFLNRTGGVP